MATATVIETPISGYAVLEIIARMSPAARARVRAELLALAGELPDTAEQAQARWLATYC